MTKLSPQQTRQCSTNALKMIYYVIIGLAITEALYRTFLKGGSFPGLKVFWANNLPSTILLFALLPTICRFVHGASIHLDMISEKRYKPLLDFIGFFIQASLFYLMAASLERPLVFSFLFGGMLLCDAFWLIFLRLINYIDLGSTEKQWMWSDFCIIGLFVMLYMINKTMACVWSVVGILIVAIVGTFLDYFLNKDFYFPTSETVTSANTM
jgi:hypothetical protein